MESRTVAAMAAGAAMAAALCASPASATIYGQQYVGTVGNGAQDIYGLFGTPGAEIGGDTYLATFTIDTSKGTYMQYAGGPGQTEGGATVINATPSSPSPVSAVLTINGHSYTLSSSNAQGKAVEAADNGSSEVFGQVTENEMSAYDQPVASMSQEIRNGVSYAGYPDRFESYDIRAGGNNYVSGDFEYSGSEGTESFELNIASATPEPSTWALLMLGIGGIGLMLRRAKRTPGFRRRDCLAA
jgi:hypothetical protein